MLHVSLLIYCAGEAWYRKRFQGGEGCSNYALCASVCPRFKQESSIYLHCKSILKTNGFLFKLNKVY